MQKLLLTLHIVVAIFVVGPLVAAANQAARVLKDGDAGALRTLSRLVTTYGWSSLVVAVFGAALVQDKYENSWSDGWLIASLLLFVAASALVIGVLAPLLRRAVGTVEAGGDTAGLVGRATPVAGVASLCYLAIAVLMVYQPGG